MIMLWWCLYEAALSAIVVALVATVPDRVPHARRGAISGVYGAGQLIGGTIGAIVGAQFVGSTGIGFIVLAVVAVVLSILFVVLAPDFSSRELPRRAMSRRDIITNFSFPRRAPDFYWAFLARLLIILGYYVIGGYQLYILTDYIGLTSAAAAVIITTASLINLVASIVGSLVSGPVSDLLRRRKVVVIIASVLIGLGAITPFVFPQPWAMLVFAGVGGLGLGIYFAVDAALMTEVLPNEATRGKDLGILNIAGSGGQILAPVLSAAIVAIGAGFAPIFVATLVLCVLAALAVIPIRKVR
jgi:MFS family permease